MADNDSDVFIALGKRAVGVIIFDPSLESFVLTRSCQCPETAAFVLHGSAFA